MLTLLLTDNLWGQWILVHFIPTIDVSFRIQYLRGKSMSWSQTMIRITSQQQIWTEHPNHIKIKIERLKCTRLLPGPDCRHCSNLTETPWCSESMLLFPLSLNIMDKILQTIFSNVFSSMKMVEFRLKFHWSWFLRVQFIIFQHWFG